MTKAFVIGGLLKVDLGNVNAGWTEGIVQVLKKVELPDGSTRPYVSGQALRRYLRDTLRTLPGVAEEISPLVEQKDPKAPVTTEGDPGRYVDDDLFGFMRAVKGGTKRRESPLRVAPAYGLFPYRGDRDLGTRSAVEARGEAEAGGSIFETEITNNVFRTTLLLELDRVGRWAKFESVKDETGELPLNERRRRAVLLLESLKYLWGGGRRTRLLVDLTPRFVAYARLGRKIPLFLDCLEVSYEADKYRLGTAPLRQVLEDYGASVERLLLGVREGFLTNADDLAGVREGVRVASIAKTLDAAAEDLRQATF